MKPGGIAEAARIWYRCLKSANCILEDKLSVNLSWSLVFVGDNATDEMRMSGHQGGHQSLQLFLVRQGSVFDQAKLTCVAEFEA